MSNTLSTDIIIIGAGSAGLSAYKEATKYSDQVLLIDQGPLGTTPVFARSTATKQSNFLLA